MVTINYFGMIAEKLGKYNEAIELPDSVSDIRLFIQERYPSLYGMTFSIAIDQEFTDTITNSGVVSEIAILPPFAGG